jgi:hypothetical protein
MNTTKEVEPPLKNYKVEFAESHVVDDALVLSGIKCANPKQS